MQDTNISTSERTPSRRAFLVGAARGLALGGLTLVGLRVTRGGNPGKALCSLLPGACNGCPLLPGCSDADATQSPPDPDRLVWQLDPQKCVQCGRCATECVLASSAVKCVHEFELCGYCELCFGYFQSHANELNAGAENQLCPTGAIRRKLVEKPYYEYTIDESLCIGCAKCVKGCGSFGNGSLYLQVRHDRCVDCNQCAIATACPANAFQRVPATSPYLPNS